MVFESDSIINGTKPMSTAILIPKSIVSALAFSTSPCIAYCSTKNIYLLVAYNFTSPNKFITSCAKCLKNYH